MNKRNLCIIPLKATYYVIWSEVITDEDGFPDLGGYDCEEFSSWEEALKAEEEYKTHPDKHAPYAHVRDERY